MEGDDPAVSFSVQLDHPVPGAVVLRVRGDFDYVTAPAVRAAIAEQSACQPSQLIVDLDGVGFLDTAGLAVLVEARQARPDLQVLCSDPRPLRTLEISGLLDWLDVAASATVVDTDRTDQRLEPA